MKIKNIFTNEVVPISLRRPSASRREFNLSRTKYPPLEAALGFLLLVPLSTRDDGRTDVRPFSVRHERHLASVQATSLDREAARWLSQSQITDHKFSRPVAFLPFLLFSVNFAILKVKIRSKITRKYVAFVF